MLEIFEKILLENNFKTTRYANESRNYGWEKCYYLETETCLVDISVILFFEDSSKISKIGIKKENNIRNHDSKETHESIFSANIDECLLFLKNRSFIK